MVDLREVLTAVELGELSHEETAQLVGVPKRTVKDRLERAREYFARRIKRKMRDNGMVVLPFAVDGLFAFLRTRTEHVPEELRVRLRAIVEQGPGSTRPEAPAAGAGRRCSGDGTGCAGRGVVPRRKHHGRDCRGGRRLSPHAARGGRARGHEEPPRRAHSPGCCRFAGDRGGTFRTASERAEFDAASCGCGRRSSGLAGSGGGGAGARRHHGLLHLALSRMRADADGFVSVARLRDRLPELSYSGALVPALLRLQRAGIVSLTSSEGAASRPERVQIRITL